LIPPSFVRTVLFNTPTSGGDYTFARLSQTALALVIGLAVLAWFWSRRWKDRALRLWLLWAVLASGPPLLIFAVDIYIVPQPIRYQLEMEMALCLLAAFALRPVMDRLPVLGRVAILAALLSVAARQTVVYRRYAKILLQPINVTETIQYQTAKWMEQNLPGRRVMACGSGGLWLNVFTDVPQLSGGHDPTALNWIQRVAVFVIYSGLNTGDRGGEISALWLKAFGVHAIHVFGPEGREFFRPFTNPKQFEGLLPVLWRQGDDTIYQVPQRSASLARVIPAAAVVARPPRHGLDVESLRAYVAALDDPSLPPAEMHWQDFNTARIRARIEPDQVVSVGITYHPGWRAAVNGSPQPIARDGLGLLLVKPASHRDDDIILTYDGGVELKVTGLVSLLVTAGVLLAALARRFTKRPAH